MTGDLSHVRHMKIAMGFRRVFSPVAWVYLGLPNTSSAESVPQAPGLPYVVHPVLGFFGQVRCPTASLTRAPMGRAGWC